MRVVEEIRRLRLIELKTEFGSYAKLNEKLHRNVRDSTLSQIANQAPDSKTGKPRVMGSPQARQIEEVLGKPPGWMDTDPALIELPGIDLLPGQVRVELVDLFGKYVQGELARLQVHGTAGVEELSAAGIALRQLPSKAS